MDPNTVARSSTDWQRIPAELRQRPQWALAGADKSPLMINGGRASTTDPTTWTTFEAVCQAAKPGQFIGYMLSAEDPFCCIDLDWTDAESQARKGKNIEPSKWSTDADEARYGRIIQGFDSYTERSTYGKGYHIFVRANIGEGCHKGIEVYSQARFIVCTGNVVHDRPIEDREAMVKTMVADLRGPAHPTQSLEDQPQFEDDAIIIERAMQASNAEKFIALARGEWRGKPEYPSQSEADFALLSIIAFYSPNNEQVRRIFRLTELGKREKATKNDRYLNITLGKLRGRQAHEEATRAVIKIQLPALEECVRKELLKFPPTMDLEKMLKSLVHVSAEQTLIAFRENPAIRTTEAGMRSLLAHNTTKIWVEDEQKGRKQVETPTFNIWKKSNQRVVVYTLTFDPREGELCNSPDGRLGLNLWRPRPHAVPTGWEALVQPFVDHVTYLVPIETERGRFLDWLAHIEQRPGELPHAHYLMIATAQGVGRNWLSTLLSRVWSGHVALDFDLVQSLGNGFNGHLSRKLLAVVDEINEGGMGERWKHSEKLKSMVTTSDRFINAKYGIQHTELNCCRWLLFSNYESALPLHEGDRRWNVIRNPSDPMDTPYYTKLYKLLAMPAFIGAVREYLLRRDISTFNPGQRAVMNEAKKAVVEASLTPEDEKAAELVASYSYDLILAEHLFHCIYGVKPSADDRETSKRWKLLAPIATKAKMEKLTKDVTLFGKRARKVWILRNPQRWRQASIADMERELAPAGI